MKFPFFQTAKNNSPYLGLLLKEDQGIAIIINTKNNVEAISNFEKFNYSNGWENIADDIDEVLYRLESKYKIHFEKTILFVYSHLIDEKTNQIKKTYYQKIKNLIKDLELKPLGFIDCRDAVVRALEQKDENKLTGIIVELDKNSLAVFIYKAGQISFAKTVTRTNNIVEDLNSVFDEIKGRILLPARIILYNSKELDLEVTKIISYRWSSDVFIQLPRVEIVQEKNIIQNLAVLFKEQIRPERASIENTASKEEAAGFVIGKDIKDEKRYQSQIKKNKLPVVTFKNIFGNISFTNFKIPFIKKKWQKKFLIIICVLIVLTALVLNEYFFHKAKIEVYVPSNILKKTLDLTAGKSGDVDLKITPVKKIWDVSVSKSTTGTKNIGDPATGEVTLYNYNKETTFAKGTKITVGGITFILDDEAKVASASLTSDGSAKLPGKAKAKITASVIGTEGNLPKGQTFQIEGLDPDIYFAKNESDFSGGSAKKVTVVSEEDIKDLKSEIIAKVKQEKPNNFNLKSDEKIINQLTTTDLTDENCSKELGEEASTVTLTAKAETTVFIYSKSELLDIIYKNLQNNLKTGFTLDKKKISYQIEDVEVNKNNINLKIAVEGKSIKTLEKDDVIKKLLGKNEENIGELLKKDFDITGFKKTQEQSLAIPFYKNLLPFFPKNFEVEIDSL